jgi:hypothetical protein
MNAAAAIAAAIGDMRFAIPVLRKGGAVAVDLETLKGGAVYLRHENPKLADAYSYEIDRQVAGMSGLTTRGTKLLIA